MPRRSEQKVNKKRPGAGIEPVDGAEAAQLSICHGHWYVNSELIKVFKYSNLLYNGHLIVGKIITLPQ